MNRQKKYVVCPDYILSKNDGQLHFIGPMKSMQPYNVNPKDCEIYEPAPYWTNSWYRAAQRLCKGLIVLAPRYHGDYNIENCTEIFKTGY